MRCSNGRWTEREKLDPDFQTWFGTINNQKTTDKVSYDLRRLRNERSHVRHRRGVGRSVASWEQKRNELGLLDGPVSVEVDGAVQQAEALRAVNENGWNYGIKWVL